MRTRILPVVLSLGMSLTFLLPAAGQEGGGDPVGIFPTHGFLVTGYGSASYTAVFDSDATPNDFGASLNPIFLFQISDRVLFESELEVGLEDEGTSLELEYAEIGYVLTRDLVVAAGKFLLPFNVFSERLHPTWINKGLAPPVLYGHHGGAGPSMPLLPILSDLGAQLRGSFDLGESAYLTAVAFVSQGPSPEVEEHEEHEEPPAEEEEIPEVAFGENFVDANENKMVGGRVGFGIAPYLEVNLSGMTARYDPEGRLRFTGLGAHLEGRFRGFELHSEWIRTDQQVEDEADPSLRESLVRNGYFAQLAYRYGPFEPMVRWGQIFDGDLGGETAMPGGRQLALGLSYWIEPALVLKAGYLINRESGDDIDNDRFGIQWAFGF